MTSVSSFRRRNESPVTTQNIYLSTTDGESLNKPEFFYIVTGIIEADDIFGFY